MTWQGAISRTALSRRAQGGAEGWSLRERPANHPSTPPHLRPLQGTHWRHSPAEPPPPLDPPAGLLARCLRWLARCGARLARALPWLARRVGPHPPPPPDPYLLRRWHALGSFCYFSHCLVTIPPPGWVSRAPLSTAAQFCCAAARGARGLHLSPAPPRARCPQVNAAHTHGVPVLGTLITEWDAGAAACADLFGSATAAVDTAARLAAIAGHYGFEGWLINIENEVARAHVPHLLLFLQCVGGCRRAQGGPPLVPGVRGVHCCSRQAGRPLLAAAPPVQ